jgi:hypothetical protein
MVSVEYALHINHIQKAREHFERECSSFLNDVTCFLNKRFDDLNSRNLQIEFNIIDNCKSSPMGHSKSFWINSHYNIMVKMGKNKNSKKEIIGTFVTGIGFDSTENSFVWYNKFTNDNVLCPQIDERCESKIMSYTTEQREQYFPNFQTHKFDEVFFTNALLDESFIKSYEDTLNNTIKVLSESITESEKFREFHGKATINRVIKHAS